MEGTPTPYRTYWIAWSALLGLTLLMIVVEEVQLSTIFTVGVLVLAMLIKATVIGGWFMHLRFERPSLAWTLVVGTMATAAVLYFLLIPDGLAAFRMAPH